jgi:hypothetical protein
MDSISDAVETTLYFLGWIQLDLYAEDGDGEYLQSNFFLPVLREIKRCLRRAQGQPIQIPPISIDDYKMMPRDYLRFIGWIYVYF